jgi:Exonuclease C-terminal
VEDQLYEGGFFPTRGDEGRIAAFHSVAPPEKFQLAQAMGDERALQLALSIIFNDWPQILSPNEYSRLERARLVRHRHSNALWMTIPEALTEITKLQASQVIGASAILDDATYLLALGASGAAWPYPPALTVSAQIEPVQFVGVQHT